MILIDTKPDNGTINIISNETKRKDVILTKKGHYDMFLRCKGNRFYTDFIRLV